MYKSARKHEGQEFQTLQPGQEFSSHFSLDGVESGCGNFQAEKFGDLTDIDDATIRRRVEIIKDDGIRLKESEIDQLNNILVDMLDIHRRANICPWNMTTRKPDCSNGKTWEFRPHTLDRLKKSKDYDELKYIIDFTLFPKNYAYMISSASGGRGKKTMQRKPITTVFP